MTRLRAVTRCPLLGVKQTLLQLTSMSAFDPNRTLGVERRDIFQANGLRT
jgi:hypothetical protein